MRLRAPAGVTLRAVDSPRPEESPAVERRAWEPEGGLASLQGWEKVHADLQWPGGKTSVWSLLCPPLVNGDMERLAPTATRLLAGLLPGRAGTSEHCLKLEDQGRAAPAREPLTRSPAALPTERASSATPPDRHARDDRV